MSEHLGEFEQVVLLAILRLGEGAYGVPIRHEIQQRASRHVSVGALYSTRQSSPKARVTSIHGLQTPRRSVAAGLSDISVSCRKVLKIARSVDAGPDVAAGVKVKGRAHV